MQGRRARPPLWLAAAAVASGWGALYTIAKWTVSYLVLPVHEDVRLLYVASEAGVRLGWPSIYDQATLRSLSASFPPGERAIDPVLTYLHPPLLAWTFAPLTIFSEPVAYALWTVVLLGALVLAWHIAAPYEGLAKATLLLATLGLWPVMLVFYFGQPVTIVLALVALAWWFTTRDRPLTAGAMIAIALFVKPQVVMLLPLTLLASGRVKVVAGCAGGSAALAVATALTLGPFGLTSWWDALVLGQQSASHEIYTLAGALGLGTLTFALWALQGAAALVLAWWRRDEPAIVFAAGILGTVTIAFHFHAADYSALVLAAYLVLRTSPPVLHRAWLLAGFAAMQVMTLSLGAPVPLLVWDASWLLLLFFSKNPRPARESVSTRTLEALGSAETQPAVLTRS